MSSALTLFLVDLSKPRAALGSNDDKLRRMICGRFKSDMARADEWFSSLIEAGAPKRYDAMKAIFAGGPFVPNYEFQYAYAYEMVCRHFGHTLNNNAFSPYRGSWLEDVEATMTALGVTAVEITAFRYGGCPAPIPRTIDVGYGEWSHEACVEALAQWNAVTPEARENADSEHISAIESCVEWMRQASARSELGVAGFGY